MGKSELREPMESLFPSKISPRGTEKSSTSVKDRLGGDPDAAPRQSLAAAARSQRPSRNEKGDGPPPDPGYK